jgi:hypothetical protein
MSASTIRSLEATCLLVSKYGKGGPRREEKYPYWCMQVANKLLMVEADTAY